MKVYVLKTLSDIHNAYEGINNVNVWVFSKLENAQVKMKEFIDEVMKYYEEKEYDKKDLNIAIEDLYFNVNNENDYYSGEIEEMEIDE